MTTIGSAWPDLATTVRNAAGAPEDAGEMTLTITGPDGEVKLGPVPVDSTEPGSYGFEYFPDDYGWWMAEWKGTGANATAYTQHLYVRQSQPWVPTPAAVHALIPIRPVFTDVSRPSLTEVYELIDLASDSVASEWTGQLAPALAGKVRYAIALNVASTIESTYFPEQDNGPEAPGEALYTRYQAELIGLRTLLSNTVADGGAFTIRPYGDPGMFPVTVVSP